MKTAEHELTQIAKYDKLIERTLNDLNTWQNRLESLGFMSTQERVQSNADLHRIETMVAFYMDYENECKRKIEYYSQERTKLIDLIEMLDGLEYDVIYLTYVERLMRYEVADRLEKSESMVAKAKKSGLNNIQNMLNEGNYVT